VRTGSRSETCSGTSRDVLRYKQGRAQVNATPLGARADHWLSCEQKRARRAGRVSLTIDDGGFTPKSGGASHPAIGPDERRRLTPQRDSDIQSELFCTSPCRRCSGPSQPAHRGASAPMPNVISNTPTDWRRWTPLRWRRIDWIDADRARTSGTAATTRHPERSGMRVQDLSPSA
jgi:hypothetical protein